MGITATSQVVYDGLNTTVMQFTGVSDSAEQENNVVKVSVADLVPRPKTVKVLNAITDVSGGTIQLSWDADSPVPFLVASSGPADDFDYTFIGGMPNGGGDTATGNILLSTQGFDAKSTYTVKLVMRKKY